MSSSTQWLFYAIASGGCAALNGVFAKLTTTQLTTTWATGISHLFGFSEPSRIIELLKALQDLSLTQDVPIRVVHDIARGVVNQVNALPYVLAPKVFNVPAPAPIHTIQAYNSGDGTPTPGLGSAAPYGCKQHTAPRPSSSLTDPFFPGTKSSVCTPTPSDSLGPIECRHVSPNKTVRFLIVHYAMGDKQDMVSDLEDTFEFVAEGYASTLGIPKSDITFTFEHGTVISLHDEPSHPPFGVYLSAARTLRSLGITDGIIILAEPKKITITVRDLMMRDEVFTFRITTRFEKLGQEYADCVANAANELTFVISNHYYGTYDVDQSEKEAWGDNLHNLGIRDGDVVTVKPKFDPSYDISFTIRDAMNKESSFTIKSTTTVNDLAYQYGRKTETNMCTLQFELEGFVFGSYFGGYGYGGDTIEQVGIYDGAIVTVRPYEQIQQESPAQTKSSIHGGWGNGTESVGSRSDSPDFNTRKNVQRDTREQDPLAKCAWDRT
ncbi:hypothetical protein B0A55_09061, partial [Friedmanniomyces simplex]